MKIIRALLFDLDGTLVDTAPEFQSAVRDFCTANGYTIPDATIIRKNVSQGARALVKMICGDFIPLAELERKRQQLLACYNQHYINSRPFNGITQLLQNLDGHALHWGIITNKPLIYADPLLNALSWSPDILVCPEHVQHTKPHPEGVYWACEKIGCTPTEAIVIGDHSRDISAGNSAGSHTVAVTYGYGDDSAPQHWSADRIIHQVDEIWETCLDIDLGIENPT